MVLNVIGTVAAVVAAVAALVTVLYARRTVLDGRTGHKELMSAQADERAAAHAASQALLAGLAEAQSAQSAAASKQLDAQVRAHAEEMAERQRAMEADARLQRLAMAERLAASLAEVARIARAETIEPPPTMGLGRETFIPSVLAQVRTSLALFYALDGPRLERSDALAAEGCSVGSQPLPLVMMAQNALDELSRAASQDESLRLNSPE